MTHVQHEVLRWFALKCDVLLQKHAKRECDVAARIPCWFSVASEVHKEVTVQ
jgi:hypothetical protein